MEPLFAEDVLPNRRLWYVVTEDSLAWPAGVGLCAALRGESDAANGFSSASMTHMQALDPAKRPSLTLSNAIHDRVRRFDSGCGDVTVVHTWL